MKLKDLTIEELKRLLKASDIIIKGDYIYANGNAYSLEMEVPQEEDE